MAQRSLPDTRSRCQKMLDAALSRCAAQNRKRRHVYTMNWLSQLQPGTTITDTRFNPVRTDLIIKLDFYQNKWEGRLFIRQKTNCFQQFVDLW